MSGNEQTEHRTTHQNGVPQGATTIMEALDAARERGFGSQLVARDGAVIECGTCSQSFEAADLDVEFTQRLEGASDAADMNIVAWGTCPNCDAGGVIILGYGPNATAADESVLQSIDMHDARTGPPEAAPDSSGGTPPDASHTVST